MKEVKEPIETIETVVEPTPAPKVEEVKQPTKQEVLRELSKEIGINLFETDGLKKVKEIIDSQKSEQEKLQEQLDAYKTKEADWLKQSQDYKAKIKASELGINSNNLEDALKLAENDPDKLAEVIKKYPMFKSKEGINIGLQDPKNTTPPSDKSEVEAYMSKDPKYRKYLEK